MALARFPVLDVCAGVWTCPHAVVGNSDEIASVCGCSASSSSWYHGKWRESQLLLGPSAGLLLPSVSVANLSGENSFSRCIVRPRSPPSPISIGRVFRAPPPTHTPTHPHTHTTHSLYPHTHTHAHTHAHYTTYSIYPLAGDWEVSSRPAARAHPPRCIRPTA